MKFIITEKQYKKLFNQNEILFGVINETITIETVRLIKGRATLSTQSTQTPPKPIQSSTPFKMTQSDKLNVYDDDTSVLFGSLGRIELKKGVYTLEDIENFQSEKVNLLPASSNVSAK